MDQEIKKEFENLAVGLNNLTEEVKSSKVDIKNLTDEVKSSKVDIKNLTEEVKGSKVDIKNLTVGLDNLTGEVKGLRKDFEDLTEVIQESFSHIEGEITSIKETMATKEDLGKLNIELRDFIDDKVDSLKDDWVFLMRKEDTKLAAVVETLHKKDIFQEKETKNILKMEPFPRLAAN
ncbi:MAG: hypothetical protein V1688_00620 [bacterium]